MLMNSHCNNWIKPLKEFPRGKDFGDGIQSFDGKWKEASVLLIEKCE